MKRILLLFPLLLVLLSTAFGQENVKDVISWKTAVQKTGDSTFKVTVSAAIKEGWHIYTATPGGDGSQIPTQVSFKKNPNVKAVGKVVVDGKVHTEEIKELDYSINYYKNKVSFTQQLVASANTTLKGAVDFQICNDQKCLNPATENFQVKIEGLAVTAAVDTTVEVAEDTAGTAVATVAAPPVKGDDAAKIKAATTTGDGSDDLDKSSLWQLFIAGFVAGFIAFIMPCIYAMLPITVSFFTKRSKSRSQGIKNAVFYSLSIILIFTAIGALVTLLFSEKTMYELSTSMGFNLFVFILFIVFGISLLGAFEITLPASWSSKLDSKSNTNSFGGIFFMALVLVIVSFSCTSAFISSLIVYIVKSQNSLGGLVGFFGFGLAIALPFALCAFFPGLLNNIAKSGGWLNTVKVTMGFIELAMAMKFLSNIDLQYHWHLLDFEVYLSIWIIIFGLLGVYLLGKVRFSHDDDLPKNMFGHTYLSVPRLFFAMASLAFTVYMIPGLWGAPLQGISGFLPERKTLDFNIHDNLISIQSNTASTAETGIHPVKYTNTLKSELPGVPSFFDFDEALAASKKLGKPLLLDFTGHSCVNCRKMERAVLSKPEVLAELKKNFLVASLYCDDKTQMAENEHFKAKDGSLIKTIGGKNLELEITRFGAVAQPLYIFVDSDGNVIKNAGGFVPDVQRFLNIMNEVKAAYKAPGK
jgi:thiol:disulfide interchange protein